MVLIDLLAVAAITALFIVAFISLRYPFVPGVLFLFAGYAVYGLAFGFGELTPYFWVTQLILSIIIFLTDYVATYFATKTTGGSKGAGIGAVLGVVVGPIFFPFAGLIAGPFIGAVLGDLIYQRNNLKQAFRSGFGAIIALFGSTLLKVIIQFWMIVVFLFWVFWVD